MPLMPKDLQTIKIEKIDDFKSEISKDLAKLLIKESNLCIQELFNIKNNLEKRKGKINALEEMSLVKKSYITFLIDAMICSEHYVRGEQVDQLYFTSNFLRQGKQSNESINIDEYGFKM